MRCFQYCRLTSCSTLRYEKRHSFTSHIVHRIIYPTQTCALQLRSQWIDGTNKQHWQTKKSANTFTHHTLTVQRTPNIDNGNTVRIGSRLATHYATVVIITLLYPYQKKRSRPKLTFRLVFITQKTSDS